MYYPGQVVFSLTKNKPVQWDKAPYVAGATIHFIDWSGKIVCPPSVKEANVLLKRRRIVPAPVHSELCWSCDRRLSNAPKDECKAINEHERCASCNGFSIYSHRDSKSYCQECSRKLSQSSFIDVAEELLKACKECKTGNPEWTGPVAEAFDKLAKLMDPFGIKEEGKMRDELHKVYMSYYNQKRG